MVLFPAAGSRHGGSTELWALLDVAALLLLLLLLLALLPVPLMMLALPTLPLLLPLLARVVLPDDTLPPPQSQADS